MAGTTIALSRREHVSRVEVTQTFLLQVILLIQRHILGLEFGAESLRNLARTSVLLAELEES